MSANYVALDVDLGVQTGKIKPLQGVNLGPLSANGWTDNATVFKELAFPYVRLHDCSYAVPETVDIHSIFPIFDAEAEDPRNYRFEITDDYIQSILDTRAQVIYRLGETIEHHTRRKYFVHPPKDFHKWANICVNIIRHYNDGWANGFHHNIRYWEIWNEPWLQPNCWTGSNEDYFRLYEITARTSKTYNPQIMVGGPAAYAGSNEFSKGFLDHCRKISVPLNFYSWHIYTMDPADIVEQSRIVREMLVEYGFSQAESHLNEWNYLPSEGWKFNSPDKAPDCIRRAFAEITGMPGATFDAAVLILMQDCPLDIANFYWARDGMWGILDSYGAPRKNYYAFKAFRSLLDTPKRVSTTPNEPVSGYALLAGAADTHKAGILLANYRAREADFAVTVKGWECPSEAVCKVYRLDYDYNLSFVRQEVLNAGNATINLCLPAPACCLLTLAPD